MKCRKANSRLYFGKRGHILHIKKIYFHAVKSFGFRLGKVWSCRHAKALPNYILRRSDTRVPFFQNFLFRLFRTVYRGSAARAISNGTQKLLVLHIDFVMIHAEAMLTMTFIKIRMSSANWMIWNLKLAHSYQNVVDTCGTIKEHAVYLCPRHISVPKIFDRKVKQQ